MATARVPMDPMRRTALIGGGWYILTFLTSVPALALYEAVLNEPEFILGATGDTAVLWGGLLEILLAASCVGTAVALYPVAKRQSEVAALGFLAARIVEAVVILAGVMSLLAVVTLRQDMAGTAGADAAALVVTGRSLIALHDWSFLIGPGLIPGINALCLGYVMYRSGLVPRVIPLMGLIGAPLLLASGTAAMFGVIEQLSPVAAIGVLPVALWELSLGVWLVAKGFNTTAPIARQFAAGTPATPLTAS